MTEKKNRLRWGGSERGPFYRVKYSGISVENIEYHLSEQEESGAVVIIWGDEIPKTYVWVPEEIKVGDEIQFKVHHDTTVRVAGGFFTSPGGEEYIIVVYPEDSNSDEAVSISPLSALEKK